MDNNLNNIDEFLQNEIILSLHCYNGDFNIYDRIESIIDELKNNTDIFNINNIDNDNIQLNIEIELPQEEYYDYFNSCKEINNKIGKPVKLKENDFALNENCLVCLEKYKILEYKRVLPNCKHYFHKKCIDKWLKKNASCPICRNKIKSEET